MLESLGYEVVEASNGADAISILEKDAAIKLLFTETAANLLNGPPKSIRRSRYYLPRATPRILLSTTAVSIRAWNF
jgi:CheY-like chemotaxis protein